MTAESVIWHDLECGSYSADLPLWLGLAADHGRPVVEIGAGTGRVAIALAQAGHPVDAVERDEELAAELAARAAGLPVTVICADACAFASNGRYGLCVVPMQTLHLLDDRAAFLNCAARSIRSDGVLAAALLGEGVEPFDTELAADELDVDGVRYLSRPTGLHDDRGTVVIERRHETIDRCGRRSHLSVERLAPLDADRLECEATAHGFLPLARRRIAPTGQYAGSEVVVLRRQR